MARRKEREIAIRMRLQGESYSEIKKCLRISKSTLSNWLHDYPLSHKRIKELRDNNPQRIENFRNTMRKKRERRLQDAYQQVAVDIGRVSERELFIAGLYLYWAEGSKTKYTEVSVSNSDPSMAKFFIKWLSLLHVPKSKTRIKLHLYSDMNIKKQILFWSHTLNTPFAQFTTPYIKRSKLEDITYKKGFGHGTCNVIFGNREIGDYVHMGLKYIREMYNK